MTTNTNTDIQTNKIYGIELSNEYIKIGEILPDGKFNQIEFGNGNKQYPLFVSFGPNGLITFGFNAKNTQSTNQSETIYDLINFIGTGSNLDYTNYENLKKKYSFGTTLINSKLHIQVKFANTIKIFTPEELLQLILSNLFDNLKSNSNINIENIVISLSDSFNLIQNDSIRKIFNNININIVRIIKNSVGIGFSYAYLTDSNNKAKNVLFCNIAKTNITFCLIQIESGLCEVIKTKFIEYSEQEVYSYSREKFGYDTNIPNTSNTKLFREYIFSIIIQDKDFMLRNEIIFCGENSILLSNETIDNSNSKFFGKTSLIVLGASIQGAILTRKNNYPKLQNLLFVQTTNYSTEAYIDNNINLKQKMFDIGFNIPLKRTVEFKKIINWAESNVDIGLIFTFIDGKTLMYSDTVFIPNCFIGLTEITLSLSLFVDCDENYNYELKAIDSSNKQIYLNKININKNKVFLG